jgi:hypothetical protein
MFNSMLFTWDHLALMLNEGGLLSINICLQLREKAGRNPAFIFRICLFQKLKMKLKWRHFEKVSDTRPFLTALRKVTSMVLLKCGRSDGITIYVPKETVWRRWQPKLSKLSQHFSFDLVLELFDRPSYMSCMLWQGQPLRITQIGGRHVY